jgi:hypothetical protein
VKGYRLLLRWAALPILDRRWAAPLSAIALGFGLFVGVAIGPGAAGTFATGAAQIIEIPGLGGEAEQPLEDEEARSQTPPIAGGPDQGADPPSSASASPSFAPLPLSEPEGAGSNKSAEVPVPKADPDPSAEERESDKETLVGVVVHLNKAAGSYVVAEQGGALTAVHAPTAPRSGTKVEVPVRPLANGTYGQAGRRLRLGAQRKAEISGIVTHVDTTSSAPAYTVSKRGASMLVHLRPDLSGPPPALPAVGSFANVEVDIEKREPPTTAAAEEPSPSAEPQPVEPAPQPATAPASSCAPDVNQAPPVPINSPTTLWQRQIDAEGAPFSYSDFAGIVIAVCPESSELVISADDVRESGNDLLFGLSTGEIDLTPVRVGNSILATATIAADEKLSITGLADDEHMRRADDVEAMQGDLAEDSAGPGPSARRR